MTTSRAAPGETADEFTARCFGDRVMDKYGGLLAVGTSYKYVTTGGQAIPIEEARKLPAMISQACDDAREWEALQAERQAAHDAWLAGEGDLR